MERLSRWGVGAVLLPLLIGCGEERPKVTGTVTYAGEPVARGMLSFQPLERYGAPVEALVTAGEFTVPVQPGKYRIRVRNLIRLPLPPDLEKMDRDTAAWIHFQRQQARR